MAYLLSGFNDMGFMRFATTSRAQQILEEQKALAKGW